MTGALTEMEDPLIDVTVDTALKQRQVKKPVGEFWISVWDEYMSLKKAFTTIFLCGHV